MPEWDLLITNARVATMRAGSVPYGVIEDAALAVQDGRIAWLGVATELPDATPLETLDVSGRWLTPALIDCHTHLVFAGNRAAEFEQRLQGISYEEIATGGGGIMSTVRATRSASLEALVEGAGKRLQALIAEGVATVEIKSGYGLDKDTEIRMLEAARSLATGNRPASIVTTFLGAHAVPPEFESRADDYVAFLIDEVLPAVHSRGLADAVDAFCERIAFSAEQVERVFQKARELGLPVKLHADQLSDGGGAELAARYDALSVDHIEYTSADGIRALAQSDSVAVLLPGAYLTLGETRQPPVDLLREHGVAIAVASDCNPGSSPICSLHINMSLACSQFGLTPEESFAGVTRQAAVALGLGDDRGTLETGKRADIAVWDFEHPRDLCYWMGVNSLHQLIVEGRI